MDTSTSAAIIAAIAAVIGGIGGVAALMRVPADRSKTIAEGASLVVVMLERRVKDLEDRLVGVEAHLTNFEVWGDKLIQLLDKSIEYIADPQARDTIEDEAERIKRNRPRRSTIRTHTHSIGANEDVTG